jgi:hypothetical protein
VKSSPYKLSLNDGLLHGVKPLTLHDYNEFASTDIKALVASGDCLVTLATVLDGATELLATKPETARTQIEKIIRTLMHLQRHYELVLKPSDHSW